MTEEKENCNFQQNYNVFGLDDKPCCYLYHKYCDEIDNCYFKRCKRLEFELKVTKADYEASEQENKELKEEIQTYGATGICEVCTEKANIQADIYCKALEEIRDLCIHYENTNDKCITNCYAHFIVTDLIQNKINEVLQ